MNEQTLDVMFSSKSNEWETPIDLFDKLNDEFNFTLDPCSTHDNHKCKKYYTIDDDGLSKDWSNNIVFVNPPYGRSIGKWVEKCYEESKNGTKIVMLIPSRTDTKWFHKYIHNRSQVLFIKGRLKFINKTFPTYNENGNFKLSPAPFPSMLVFYNCDIDLREMYKLINKK